MANTVATERQCYICYDKESDSPSAAWTSACPCSLEAHEQCLLRWVAEQEVKGEKDIRCSACRAPIRVVEPRDPVLHLRDRLHRAYSRVSPFVLMWLVYAGGVAGSGCYGLAAAEVFAGPGPAMAWLGMPRIRRMAGYAPIYRVPAFWEASLKFWALSLLGPGIVLTRALPAQMRGVFLPCSIVVCRLKPCFPALLASLLTAPARWILVLAGRLPLLAPVGRLGSDPHAGRPSPVQHPLQAVIRPVREAP